MSNPMRPRPKEILICRVALTELELDGETEFTVKNRQPGDGAISIDLPADNAMLFPIRHVHRQVGAAVPVEGYPSYFDVVVAQVPAPKSTTWAAILERLGMEGLPQPVPTVHDGIDSVVWPDAIEAICEALGF